MNEKTNVMRILDGKKIPYQAHTYEQEPSMTGEEIAPEDLIMVADCKTADLVKER